MVRLPWESHPRTQVIECSVEDYDRARHQFMGSHMLELFRFSPRQCQWKMQGLIPSSSTSFYDFGRAFHCFILEGAGVFHSRYEIAEGPINPKTGSPYGRDSKAFQSWYEEITASGRQIISGEEFVRIQMMAESIEETASRELLEVGRAELTIRGRLYGVDCQSRLDFFDANRGILVDLKTTESLGRFEKDFWRYGYNRQMAFYKGMAEGLGLSVPIQVYVIAVEKGEPHRTHCWALTEATLSEADESNKASLLQYRQLVANLGYDKPWPLSLEYGRTIGTL